ncbi:15-hydroxyprostaglandin dehydrogenase [NAD(+)] [Parasteatoda tepidariorum]|uniref:15-hydroxyprostaglandin dehydrogenase [NAD(+)] n=1 Tax=Parasteatoda tepidariorum TaxID=114398 RepID=UPI00077F9E8C|nr:15-hydroxyprostaglandin dehydrogenase [NAD(+)] [Parasteatoda tepidariorum]
MSMKGKVALVTGGARGIGRAYTTALLNNGVKVCICDVNEITASEFIGSLPDNLKKNAFFQKCDVTDHRNFKDAFDKTIEVFGKIDIVVNNAGVQDEHNWKKTIEVNLMAVIQGVKLAFQYMGVDNGGKGGSVVNTASVAGLVEVPISPVYCATKHAVVGLTKSYGAEYHLKKSGIKVNAICPGAVNTYLYQTFAPSCLDEEEGKKFAEAFPLVPFEDLGKGLIQILEDGKNGSLLVVDDKGPHYV